MSEAKKIKYKITATVIKHGGAPTTWIHYSEKKLTQTQCVKMLSTRTQVGKTVSVKVTLSDFVCVKESVPFETPAKLTNAAGSS